MGRSLRIGRIGGTPISVNGGLAVLAALFILSLTYQAFPRLAPDASATSRLAVASVAVLAFLISILAHELGHATLAKRHGVGVLGITLTLLGGVARLDRQAPTPRAELLIAAAGPAVNLAIGGAVGAVFVAINGWSRPTLGTSLWLASLAWLAAVNLALAALNLVPAAPLDGGRVLTALLWQRLRDAEWARVLSGRAGLVLGGVLTAVAGYQVLTGRTSGLITLVVGLFLFTGARSEITSAVVRRRLARTTAADVMIADPPSVADSLTVEQLRRFAGDDRQGVAFPVVRWTADPVGYVVPDAGRELADPDRSWTTVAELMQPVPEVSRAWSTEPVDHVLERLASPENVLVVVHEPSAGRVVGTLSGAQMSGLFVPPDTWGRDRRPAPAR